MTTTTNDDDRTAAADIDVRRRAMRLCLPAEPHSDTPPCAKHIREARSQLAPAPELRALST